MAKIVCKIITIFILLAGARGSSKKGVAVAPRAYKCDDLKVLDNVAWWYDWGGNFDFIESESNCDLTPYASKYVPMIWGYKPGWYENYHIEANTQFLLGFNEPNHGYQANLTPEEAAAAWPIVEAFADGRVLVSPSPAKCGSNCITATSLEWFQQFFSILCANESSSPCRMSYLATHVYQWNCRASKAMDELKLLYDTFGLKIWLTEFSCPTTTDPAVELSFMKDMLILLEQADYVYRYSWYVHRSSKPDSFITRAADLFEVDSSTLTTLGEYYNEFGRPDPPPPGVCPRRSRR